MLLPATFGLALGAAALNAPMPVPPQTFPSEFLIIQKTTVLGGDFTKNGREYRAPGMLGRPRLCSARQLRRGWSRA